MTEPGTAAPLPAPISHVVAAGDTLGKIAQQYGVTLDDLLSWNAISNPDLIQIGQTIELADPNVDKEYIVVAGDTVSELAARFGKRWVDIAAVNKLDDVNLIYVGQKLIIPAQGVARGR
ncbi:LysM peptidoglycan-binding domain-containing protein [Propioniciclava coleopterorum]|uniref:LysM peptidoglycan-binding domain-containing protein n=1 Tax=Propioniciclava coleopterorum TaxID=2714937 RepID=A0A6G7Y3L1_9ACTN|nr:LysM domain-containing protein [Propioniciclava coleopterorum]QIK71211.1 LysM peptidoglycan-binding domain-containing protein [Propioniciclava coleopterorum]